MFPEVVEPAWLISCSSLVEERRAEELLPEFRRKALDLLKAGRSVADLARDLQVSDQTIYNWRRQELVDTGQLPGIPQQRRVAVLAVRNRTHDRVRRHGRRPDLRFPVRRRRLRALRLRPLRREHRRPAAGLRGNVPGPTLRGHLRHPNGLPSPLARSSPTPSTCRAPSSRRCRRKALRRSLDPGSGRTDESSGTGEGSCVALQGPCGCVPVGRVAARRSRKGARPVGRTTRAGHHLEAKVFATLEALVTETGTACASSPRSSGPLAGWPRSESAVARRGTPA